MYNIISEENFISVPVKVVPKSSKETVMIENEIIKVKISAPPTDGKANKYLIEFLSKILDIAKNRIELVHGETSRNKVLRITGISESEFLERIK
ncbi:MAG: DUF167 domain-containing protein [bacterium]|nr:DUF167 domain-containing protein [bacterium]